MASSEHVHQVDELEEERESRAVFQSNGVVDRIEDGEDAASRPDPEDLARALEAFPEFRVLRALEPRTVFAPCEGRTLLRGVIADVETTGLDPASAEILEVGLLSFSYTPDGAVIATEQSFSGLRQPAQPIAPPITLLTGITDKTVHGLSISPDAVDEFIGSCSLVISHNAAFDHAFLTRFCPRLGQIPWGCSLTQVPWREEGFVGARLHDLANHHGYFFRSHRALDDCRALLEVLARPLPQAGVTALATLLQAVRRPTMRIWARGAPFEFRNVLKSSGYRWHSGTDGRPRAWWKDVGPDELDVELGFLTEFYFCGTIDPLVEKVDALTRFSARP